MSVFFNPYRRQELDPFGELDPFLTSDQTQDDEDFPQRDENGNSVVQTSSQQGPQVHQPVVIPPSMSRPRPGMEQYLKHIQSMPSDKPNTLTAIMSAIGGFATAWGSRDPGAGLATTEHLLRSPYERQLNEWKSKGHELGAAAGLEGRAIESDMDYAVKTGNLGARNREVDVRQQKVENDLQVAEQKLAELKKQGADKKAIADAQVEIDRKRNEIDQFKANTDRSRVPIEKQRADAVTTSAGAAVTSANAQTTRANAYKDRVAQTKPGSAPKPQEVYDAEQDVLANLIRTDPMFSQYWVEDKATGEIRIKEEEWDEMDLQEIENMQTQVGSLAQRRLEGNPMGGYRYRPRVIPPPNRRIP